MDKANRTIRSQQCAGLLLLPGFSDGQGLQKTPPVLILAAAMIQISHVSRLIDMTVEGYESGGLRHAQSLAALHTTASVALTGLIGLQLAQRSIEQSLINKSRHHSSSRDVKHSASKGFMK
ncbi:hypothetical protein BY996DRAFT_6408597 [Phakopsora pachyrhizi]|nr:hypothetical protein BY996DRAFT_6408597 [Phakopsora pachyrhizi]